jgi:hypothetical protein
MKRLVALKTVAAACLIACVAAMLAACDALQTIAPPIATARNFAFAYKKLPEGTTLAEARTWMRARFGGPRPASPAENDLYLFAENILSSGSEWYSGNKANNTRDFQLRVIPRSTVTTQGEIIIKARDALVSHFEVPGQHIGSTGAVIDMRPFPNVNTPVESAEFHFFVTEDGDAEVSTEYVNMNDPLSYFRLEFTEFNEETRVVAGTFEGLAVAQSGPHTGRIYAITDGEFLMDMGN